jgi:DNA replication licensing factor MCM6
MPRSLDVILRSEMVERAKAGDKCVFSGTFIVVPDVSQLGLPGGNKAEMQREANKGNASTGGVGGSGVTGLKELGRTRSTIQDRIPCLHGERCGWSCGCKHFSF